MKKQLLSSTIDFGYRKDRSWRKRCLRVAGAALLVCVAVVVILLAVNTTVCWVPQW